MLLNIRRIVTTPLLMGELAALPFRVVFALDPASPQAYALFNGTSARVCFPSLESITAGTTMHEVLHLKARALGHAGLATATDLPPRDKACLMQIHSTFEHKAFVTPRLHAMDLVGGNADAAAQVAVRILARFDADTVAAAFPLVCLLACCAADCDDRALVERIHERVARFPPGPGRMYDILERALDEAARTSGPTEANAVLEELLRHAAQWCGATGRVWTKTFY